MSNKAIKGLLIGSVFGLAIILLSLAILTKCKSGRLDNVNQDPPIRNEINKHIKCK